MRVLRFCFCSPFSLQRDPDVRPAAGAAGVRGFPRAGGPQGAVHRAAGDGLRLQPALGPQLPALAPALQAAAAPAAAAGRRTPDGQVGPVRAGVGVQRQKQAPPQSPPG